MRRLLLCVLVATACGDNTGSRLHDDAGMSGSGDAGAGAPGRVSGCLDTAGVGAAPTDQLPCDLVPPGVQL